MSLDHYAGRHRPANPSSRGRQIAVPLALFSSTVAAALVVTGAAGSELSSNGTAMTNLSTSVSGSAFAADLDAAGQARLDQERASRDSARTALVAPVAAEQAKAEAAAKAAAAAKAKAAAATKAKAAAAAKAKAAAAAKAKAAAAAKAKAAGVGGGTGDASGDGKKVGAISGARGWVTPFAGYRLTSGYGQRWGKLHPAQDLAAKVGTPVRALSSGQVTFAGWSNQGYGYLVKIQYWDGTVSWYAHNSRLLVRTGQKVVPGQKVSRSGNTGNSTGPHLHLEIHPKGKNAVPPRPWLASKGISL